MAANFEDNFSRVSLGFFAEGFSSCCACCAAGGTGKPVRLDSDRRLIDMRWDLLFDLLPKTRGLAILDSFFAKTCARPSQIKYHMSIKLINMPFWFDSGSRSDIPVQITGDKMEPHPVVFSAFTP